MEKYLKNRHFYMTVGKKNKEFHFLKACNIDNDEFDRNNIKIFDDSYLNDDVVKFNNKTLKKMYKVNNDKRKKKESNLNDFRNHYLKLKTQIDKIDFLSGLEKIIFLNNIFNLCKYGQAQKEIDYYTFKNKDIQEVFEYLSFEFNYMRYNTTEWTFNLLANFENGETVELEMKFHGKKGRKGLTGVKLIRTNVKFVKDITLENFDKKLLLSIVHNEYDKYDYKIVENIEFKREDNYSHMMTIIEVNEDEHYRIDWNKYIENHNPKNILEQCSMAMNNKKYDYVCSCAKKVLRLEKPVLMNWELEESSLNTAFFGE